MCVFSGYFCRTPWHGPSWLCRRGWRSTIVLPASVIGRWLTLDTSVLSVCPVSHRLLFGCLTGIVCFAAARNTNYSIHFRMIITWVADSWCTRGVQKVLQLLYKKEPQTFKHSVIFEYSLLQHQCSFATFLLSFLFLEKKNSLLSLKLRFNNSYKRFIICKPGSTKTIF